MFVHSRFLSNEFHKQTKKKLANEINSEPYSLFFFKHYLNMPEKPK